MRTRVIIVLTICLTALYTKSKGQALNDTIESDTIQLSESDSILAVVYVSFYVNRKGKIKDIGIEKVENVNCDAATLENLKNEALRVVRAVPEMDSSKKDKKVKMILPIKFRSNDVE